MASTLTRNDELLDDTDLWSINYLIDSMKKHLANVKQPIINRNEGLR